MITRSMLVPLLLCAACASNKEGLEADALAEAEELQVLFQDHVKDPDRAAQLQAVQAKVQQTIAAFFKDFGEANGEWLRLNSSYDTDPAAFSSLQGLTAASRGRRAEDLIRLAMEARKIATAEEWAAMNEDRRKR